jgi:hypothetical protein
MLKDKMPIPSIASLLPRQEIISLLQNIQNILKGNNQSTPKNKKYSGEDKDFHYQPKTD